MRKLNILFDCTSLPLDAFCVLTGVEDEDWLLDCVDWVEWTQPRYFHQN
ncbi:hypothetical protein ES705_27341 [subsurface metagenome]